MRILPCIILAALGIMPLAASASSTPRIWKITPTTAVVDEDITFSARVSDDDVLDNCTLFLDKVAETDMTVKRDIVYATLDFDTTGSHTIYARCTDAQGITVSGPSVTLSVQQGTSYVEPGTLIKLGCEGDVYPNDPCTAVYYYGVDGKRHAFTTESVFKSWYNDFDDLVILSAQVLSSIPLGKNVSYRPGERMVKFSTNTVYAVSYGGLLRPIANAEIAEAMFGSDWISLIEIVDDVFYGNYRIGAGVESSSSFSWSSARSVTKSIDQTL